MLVPRFSEVLDEKHGEVIQRVSGVGHAPLIWNIDLVGPDLNHSRVENQGNVGLPWWLPASAGDGAL